MSIDWSQMKTKEQLEAEAAKLLIPSEVPRWAGRLALKRHILTDGKLEQLAADSSSEDNLLNAVVLWAATLPEGEQKDRVYAELDEAKDWMRNSQTVQGISQVLGLTEAQVDALFTWAAAQ